MLALPAHSRRCFLQASRGTARQAKGARRPPPAANQSRHVATGGAAAAGVASPPLVREPGIAGQLGSGRGLGQISLPMGLWGATPSAAGCGASAWRGCCSCLETLPEVSARRHLQPRRNSHFRLRQRALLRAGIKQRSSRRLCLGGSMAGALPSS